MRRARVVELTAALALATSACSLLTSLDGLSNGAAPARGGGDAGDAEAADARSDAGLGGDGATGPIGDGSTTPDVRDAGDQAGPNLHPQGTFETGTCDPWVGFQGTVNLSSVAHTGAGACRVCMNPGTNDYFTGDDSRASGPGQVGATYRAEGWVRTDPTSPAPPSIVFFLRNATYINGVFMGLESNTSPAAAIDATWQRFETTLTFTKPGNLNVFISGDHAPNACFLFDDVVVQRIQ